MLYGWLGQTIQRTVKINILKLILKQYSWRISLKLYVLNTLKSTLMFSPKKAIYHTCSLADSHVLSLHTVDYKPKSYLSFFTMIRNIELSSFIINLLMNSLVINASILVSEYLFSLLRVWLFNEINHSQMMLDCLIAMSTITFKTIIKQAN